MGNITISEEKFNKVLSDVETLIQDVAELLSQDDVGKQRRAEILQNPSLGKSEKELDDYLRKRGLALD
ncbi:MAG TPA: hypothetical protein VJH22_02060 [Candidatus Nanoarchaeia archaeon]|nr:hypothetical protein [Candidatus Nanoarchaeia archaeon]